jgi:colanic acid biosynthesis glycosyl transferase WcaI
VLPRFSGREPARLPLKIVFVNRYFSPDESATSRMLSELAFRLAASGLSVAVVTSRQLYEDPKAQLAPRESIRGVEVHRVPTATRGRARIAGRALDYASFHIAAGLELLRILSRGDVVVAKTDPPLISIAVARAAAWRGATLINWLQDLFPEVAAALAADMMPKWLESGLLAARDRSLRHAAVNVVLSDGMRAKLLARGIDSRSVRVVPNWANGVDAEPITVAMSGTRHRAGLDRCFVLGYSGNLGRAHEFETLLGAARLLRADPEIAFLITGGGAKAGALQRSVQAEGLINMVFQDYQPAALLADSMAAADAHFVSLLPAMEGLIMPSKLYGILAAGRPAIFVGDPDGDVARVIRENECGITVNVGQSAQLAAELRALRGDPQRTSAMGARSRALALARYTSAHAVNEWLGMLGTVAPQLTAGRVLTPLAHL